MQNPSTLHTFGKNLFGPFLLGFALWLKREAMAHRTEHLVFLSRDGFLMQKAFNIVCGENEMSTSYAYFSRNSIRRCLIHKAEGFEETIDIFGDTSKLVTVAELLCFYGVTEAAFNEANAICRTSLSWNKSISSANLKENSELRAIVNHLWKEICYNSAEQEKLIKAYAGQKSMAGRFAIVDIGWHGSMQRNIEKLLPEQKEGMLGLYVGMDRQANVEGATRGWLFNDAESPMRKKLLCFFGVIEKFFQSQEGSTDHYSADADGAVHHELLDYEYPIDSDIVRNIREIQDGALAYVEEHRNDADFDDQKAIADFIRFGTNPTAAELALFKEFYNTDGTRVYYLPQKSLFAHKPKEFLANLAQSPWKTGFLKAALRLPLPYFGIYSLLKK